VERACPELIAIKGVGYDLTFITVGCSAIL